MDFMKISPVDMKENVFDTIGNRWMLLTAGDREKFNTMTVSWGGLGVLWGMNVATCYVRPQRYTYEFMESSEYFTLSTYSDEYKKQLGICGSKSGRDIDKAAECGFTADFAQCGAPYFQQADLVLVCKKLYSSDFDPKNFFDGRIKDCYNPDDYHRMYIGEIVEILSGQHK